MLANAGAARLSASAPEATAASPMRRKEVFIIVSRSGGHHGFSGEAARLVPHPRQDHQRSLGESREGRGEALRLPDLGDTRQASAAIRHAPSGWGRSTAQPCPANQTRSPSGPVPPIRRTQITRASSGPSSTVTDPQVKRQPQGHDPGQRRADVAVARCPAERPAGQQGLLLVLRQGGLEVPVAECLGDQLQGLFGPAGGRRLDRIEHAASVAGPYQGHWGKHGGGSGGLAAPGHCGRLRRLSRGGPQPAARPGPQPAAQLPVLSRRYRAVVSGAGGTPTWSRSRSVSSS